MLVRKLPKVSKSIAYVPRGPVIDATCSALFAEFTAGLRDAARRRGAILLKIDPPIPIEDQVSGKSILSAGFRLVSDAGGFGGTQPKCVMVLGLSPSIEDLLAGFKPKWRYNIRLAEKKGVVVNSDCTREDLRAFHELYRVTARRDGFAGRPLSYFEALWDVLVPPGFGKLFLVTYEGRPIAGAFDFVIGNRAMYVYGASSNEHRNLMPNHLMQWEMIQWAKSLGCKSYDFRGVSPRRGSSDAEDHLQGLNRFKEGFSPSYMEYIGEYDLPLSPLWYWAWMRAQWIRGVMKRRARATAAED
jgi:lipid II:glycine glycyltransferase (peptidoglycan interpeptide bridge formation enzyme)